MLLKEAAAGRYQHNFYNELSRVSDELANAHRELAKQILDFERANRLKNQFLGMVAHDLRNPIASILSLCDLLSEDAAPGSPRNRLDSCLASRSRASSCCR